LNKIKWGNTKDLKIIWAEMELAEFFMQMEDIIKDSGRTIECKDMVNCIIRIIEWPMRDTGSIINLMEMVEFIMIYLIQLAIL